MRKKDRKVHVSVFHPYGLHPYSFKVDPKETTFGIMQHLARANRLKTPNCYVLVRPSRALQDKDVLEVFLVGGMTTGIASRKARAHLFYVGTSMLG